MVTAPEVTLSPGDTASTAFAGRFGPYEAVLDMVLKEEPWQNHTIHPKYP